MSSKRKSDSTTDVAKKCKNKRSFVDVALNSCISTDDDFESLRQHYGKEEYALVKDIKVCTKPYSHCIITNLIKNEDFIEQLQEEILDLSFTQKNNDLYKFHQSTEDLKVTKLQFISAIRDIIYEEIRTWISKITGIDLNSQVDLSCASYRYTDVLSCHDDELDDRRVAFIYYLVPSSWKQEDGGALQLFSLDEYGEPLEVVKSISPVRNSFVFFEVTPASFHQVQEILTEDKTRLSISGWFHGTKVDRQPPHVESLPDPCPAVYIEEDEFYSWINPMYLDSETQTEIRTVFSEESQIELNNFLQENKYEEVRCAVAGVSKQKWIRRRPANKRNYMKLDLRDPPECILQCLRFLQSDAFFLILSSLTGLKLHELAEVSEDEEDNEQNTKGENASCLTEVRKWQHGCYSLVHDTDVESMQCALDSVLFFDCEDWKPEFGGMTSYIARGEDEELLSVNPTANSLALVYRDKDTLKFVKHINCRINEMNSQGFTDISTVYYE